MSAKVISIINYKGGVAKTASTYNIAFGLSFLNGHKVLIIDLDPQCSLSTICMKALSETKGIILNVSDLKPEQTINSVIKDYLVSGEENPNIDLDTLITKDFYTTYYGKTFTGVHFIPATMYEKQDSNYDKGLDDLEIDIVRNYANKISTLDLVTIFAKFFVDTKINESYDFILFDCPPANNVITQNALLVSDYYLIPTIMDDMSSNGINHLINVIENSVYSSIYNDNQRVIERSDKDSYLKFLKKEPELLGIFETLRKSQVHNNQRYLIAKQYGNKLFNEIIYHHKPTADSVSNGRACFSLNINPENPQYSPHYNYGELVLNILSRLNIPKTKSTKTNDWL
ncbi:AAA family ATPase [Clostridium sp.]|uniref:ParA family protein n=1 Tax=Clostridium sp. TaxID=1506 RepID=UPI0025874549|nr:AAA family ATPase [Clostridium sp.]MDF2503920.1 chromosome partitioning protein ParA [Clostridium sp.]